MTATHTTASIRAPTVPMTAKKIELVELDPSFPSLVGVTSVETHGWMEQLQVLRPVILKTRVLTLLKSKREKLRVMFMGEDEVC